MFSDGYKDQFGGADNKKFLSKRLKEMLIGICKKPMEEQLTIVEENLKNWMGNNIQVDDICVMGIKLV